MFGSMKKAMALGAIVAVGVVAAPAAVNAASWTTSGSTFSGTMTAQAHGGLTLIPVSGAWRVTCDVSVDLSLVNPNATLSVTGATFANCTTNMPGCTATATASTLPWAGSGDALTQEVTIGSVALRVAFGPGCPPPLSGLTVTMSGGMSPLLDSANQLLVFDVSATSGQLTSPLGTAHWGGELLVTAPGDLGLI